MERHFVSMFEVVNVPVTYAKGEKIVVRKVCRAKGVEANSIEHGEHLAHVMFCEMRNDRLNSGKLVAELTTTSGCNIVKAETVELNLDQWAIDNPDEVLSAERVAVC